MEKSIKKRIVEITNRISIKKNGKNTFSNYKYFEPDTILGELNPLLYEYNLITIFNLINKGDYYESLLTIEDCDTNDKVIYQFDIDKAVVKGANEAQNSGATLTYAKRYSLMNAFNIADNNNDMDSNAFQEKYIYINEEERKELFRKAKGNNELVLKVIGAFGYENTTTIQRKDYLNILKEIGQYAK